MKKVIIVLGPTGVGKTAASILLAKELQTEIISADSMQIYRGMDIGTAKPSKEELKEVRHHLIDIVEPTEFYSAGQYISTVSEIIEDLHKKNKIPVVVGGTGLYIRTMTRGIFGGPSADLSIRDELLSMERHAPGCLYANLAGLDPEAVAGIEKNDLRRIVRAVEVCMKSGDKISTLQKELTSALPYEFIKIGLNRDRKELYTLIDERVDKMLEAGFVAEVERLLAKNPGRTAMQAIGYREIAACLRGEIQMEEAVRLIKRNTRRYAKRQFTWFRNEENISWIDVTGIFSSSDIFQLFKPVLASSLPEYFHEA
jgi:tRNA dimethylallyltransferase